MTRIRSSPALGAAFGLRREVFRRDARRPWEAFPAVPASLPTKTYYGPGGATPLASPTAVPYNTSSVTGLGVVPVDDTTNQYRNNGVNSIGTGNVWAVEFDHYGDDVVFLFRANNTLVTTWTWVDGAPITAAPEAPQGVTITAGMSYRLRLQFPSVALRRIRVYLHLAAFRGIEHPKTATVLPTPRPAVAAAWFGDSFVQGANGVDDVTTLAATTSRLLGWECYNAGQGGTGYIATGSGNNRAYTDSGRLSSIATAAPELVVVFGSVNDDAQTASAIQTAAASVYSTLAASLPSTKLIVVGPPPNSATSTAAAGRTTNRDAVKAAAQAAPNVLAFLDPLAEGWLTGTGNAAAPAADGNRDLFLSSDSVHLTKAGHDYFARRLAQRISDVLAA